MITAVQSIKRKKGRDSSTESNASADITRPLKSLSVIPSTSTQEVIEPEASPSNPKLSGEVETCESEKIIYPPMILVILLAKPLLFQSTTRKNVLQRYGSLLKHIITKQMQVI